MEFTGFTEEDFNVFLIDGLENRMDALKTIVRPKLELLGEHFAPTLSTIVGDEMFYHVAKHARRSVNPPNDTWVAFANNKRGYKQHPHFQIGLWKTHVFIWFAMIYEAPNKAEFGRNLEKNIQKVREQIPGNFVWSGDHMKPDASTFSSLSEDEFIGLIHRVQNVKKAEILCGIHLNSEQAINMSGSETLDVIENTLKTLSPLYKMV